MPENMKEIIEKMDLDEETKKIVDEMTKEGQANIWGTDIAWFLLIMLLFLPHPDNSYSHYDKQTISYLQGKIDAYEKMMEG